MQKRYYRNKKRKEKQTPRKIFSKITFVTMSKSGKIVWKNKSFFWMIVAIWAITFGLNIYLVLFFPSFEEIIYETEEIRIQGYHNPGPGGWMNVGDTVDMLREDGYTLCRNHETKERFLYQYYEQDEIYRPSGDIFWSRGNAYTFAYMLNSKVMVSCYWRADYYYDLHTDEYVEIE